MLEKVVEQHLKRQVELLGGRCYKWSSPSNNGVPDRIVFVKNQIWFIELKSPTGKMSKLQQLFFKFVKDYTSNYAVLSTLNEVDIWILKISQINI